MFKGPCGGFWELDLLAIGNWASHMSQGNATLSKPPLTPFFDYNRCKLPLTTTSCLPQGESIAAPMRTPITAPMQAPATAPSLMEFLVAQSMQCQQAMQHMQMQQMQFMMYMEHISSSSSILSSTSSWPSWSCAVTYESYGILGIWACPLPVKALEDSLGKLGFAQVCPGAPGEHLGNTWANLGKPRLALGLPRIP
ncbi:hypothetical protein BDP27DRAFT_1437749 [Rhodocollybia butyracea]|uniref:Uncharacterized protein n=1 Tax=Rhodocollybia butyracea TaxID=206335 RepID=A0A9P5TVY9_9AGAR|nr:hypothetical protein BDP27DRAFT_1437749 [Rhodocollybia butyracea]